VFERLIKKITRYLDKNKIPYMIIGGQAVLLYGSPRLTRDIDITLGIDTEEFSKIEKICKKANLKILPKNPEAFANETKVLPAEDEKSGIRVDFIFSFSNYERQAIQRARKVSLAGYSVRFASCEDVIIHKVLAARSVDEEDVRNILIKNKDSINLKYIKSWLSEFSNISEQKQALKRFKRLWNLTKS